MKSGAEAKPEFLREEGLRLLLFGGKDGVGKTTCSALRRAEEPLLGRYDAACAGRHMALVFRQEEPRRLDRLRALSRALYVASGLPDFSQTKRRMQWNLTEILS